LREALKKLYLIELRRQWTVGTIFIPISLLILSGLTLLITAKTSKVYNITNAGAMANLSLVVPLAACLFAVGAIAGDVREHWLRTVLIRPISRQQYLLIKLAAVYTSVVLTIVVAGILPNIIIAEYVAKGEVQFNLGLFLSTHGLILLQALLLLALLMFFSCWVPGVMNVVVLGGWGIAASGIGAYLQLSYWSDKWFTILRDYLFPSGFSDAIEAITAGKGTPVAQMLWGLGALAVSLALAFWSITKIQVDKSSE